MLHVQHWADRWLCHPPDSHSAPISLPGEGSGVAVPMVTRPGLLLMEIGDKSPSSPRPPSS